MTASTDEPENTADLRGPGDPNEAASPPDPGASAPEAGMPTNIREEQQTAAPGTVPPSYVGSGSPGSESKPEEALEEEGMWDEPE